MVPLDDRPCNRLFPVQLAPAAGWEVRLPPRESLGWFTEPGDCDAIADWLRKSASGRLVVSLDMLCYGGLVASRSPAAQLDLAMRRLDALRSLRRDRPDLAIYAFSLITRLGTTVASAADLEIHQLLRAYSQLVDRVERLGEQEPRAELDAVSARLDPSILASYLGVRRRNHAINRSAIQLLADGVVDYLVLAQEDAAPVGLHVPEQLSLRDQAAEFRVNDRASIHPGADEVGLVLTARHCLSAGERPLGIAVDYATDAGADITPQFENQPLRQTIESQILAAGARPVVPREADAILFVHTPRERQRDITEAPPLGETPSLSLQAESMSERIRAAKAAGRPLGLADAAYCNGADPELIAALARTGAARHLHAFAAWNTAANTVGTVVSQLCLEAAADRAGASRARAAGARFLACRLVDDYGYQSQVRRRAIARAEATGTDPYALGGAWAELEQYVSAELEPLAHSIYSELLAGPEDGPLGEVSISLPWRRLFEVEVELTRYAESKNLL
ncbi:MAG: DUF4127 family protein [Armatimonadota bacterium]|nr:DUF4127 family protein [Armatimonadota bacterium]